MVRSSVSITSCIFMFSLSLIRPNSSNCPESILRMPDASTCFTYSGAARWTSAAKCAWHKTFDIAPEDQPTREFQECLVDIVLPLVANFQPPIAVQLRHCPLYCGGPGGGGYRYRFLAGPRKLGQRRAWPSWRWWDPTNRRRSR